MQRCFKFHINSRMCSRTSFKMAKLFVAFALVLGSVLAEPATFNVVEDLDWRIVGGSTAPNGAYPYQISLRTIQNSHFCGGSIISSTHILTAAHCVYGKSPSSMMVVVGTNQLNSGGTAYGVRQIIAHQGYDPQNNKDDIALLLINGNIQYGPKVQPIALATSNPPAGALCTLSGWGLTSYPSNIIPNNLQHINLQARSIADCQRALPSYPIFNTHVCTMSPRGQGACQGDSGGPLVYGGRVTGVVSWGIPCALGNPDLFTSVAAYYNWIVSYAKI